MRRLTLDTHRLISCKSYERRVGSRAYIRASSFSRGVGKMRKFLFSLATTGAVLSATALFGSSAHAAAPLSESELDGITAGASVGLTTTVDTSGSLNRIWIIQKEVGRSKGPVTVVVGVAIGVGIGNGSAQANGNATASGDWSTTSNPAPVTNNSGAIKVSISVNTGVAIDWNRK